MLAREAGITSSTCRSKQVISSQVLKANKIQDFVID